jgi:uncharacterized protein YutE (UPF0331/DUF86 family)
MDINQIISFILNPTFSGWLLFFKTLFIFFSLLFLGFIIFALFKTTWLKRLIIWDLQEFLTYRPFGVSKVERKWQKIKKRLETETESEAKLAIIEADSMLDGILDRMGFGGRTLGERLDKLTAVSLPNIEEVKQAHKIRNNIVHDPTYKLDLEEAKKVISAYEKALTDLQAL